jgi:DNA polymerase-3 subunit delta
MAKDVTIGQIIRRIQSNEISPAYSLFGNEPFLQDFFIQELDKGFSDETGSKKYITLDDDKETDFLAELSAYSLFNERQLLIVRQIKKLTKGGKDELLEYLKSPNPSTCLVLISEEYDDRKALQKSLKAETIFVDVRVPFANKIKEWVNFIVKSREYKINPGTITRLIDMYGDSISHVINEIDKMELLCGPDTEIDEDVLKNHLSSDREYAIWDLQDALGRKELDRSLTIIRSQLENGASIQQLTASLANLFHQMLWVSMGKTHKGGYVGLSTIVMKKMNVYCRVHSQEDINNTLLFLRKTDMLSKSTSLSDFALIEPVVVSICTGKYV